jgi:hypothetical protein
MASATFAPSKTPVLYLYATFGRGLCSAGCSAS